MCIDDIGRKKTTEEAARKHFTDPFRYWHPVTNNNVQKLKVLLVALLVESLFLAKVEFSWSFRGVFFSNATVKY